MINKNTKQIHTYLNQEELKIIKKASKQENRTISAYLKHHALINAKYLRDEKNYERRPNVTHEQKV